MTRTTTGTSALPLDAPAPSPPPAVGRMRWVILAVLFGATTVNYMDRFLLGVLKPAILDQWRWTEIDYGNVVFCFQLAYGIGLLSVSRLIDRLGVRAGMALVVTLCAIAAASHSFGTTVFAFCMSRLLLGFSESGTWPGCMKAIAEWFPRKERSLSAGVVNAGSSVGATITPLLVPLVLTLVAWRFSFLFTATLDVLWLAVWLAVYRRPDRHPLVRPEELAYIYHDPPQSQGKVNWLSLFRHRQTWAFLIAKGLCDPVWWFYLFWVPGFLVKQYGLASDSAAASAAAMALPIMVIYVMADLGSVGGGWLSTHLIARGWSINLARKSVMLGCALCVTPVSLVIFHIGLWPSVLLIGLAAAAHLGFSANLFTVATDTVPPQAVSSVAGIGGTAAAIGGMVVAKLVGFVLETTHSYLLPFAAAAAAYWVALAAVQILLPRLESMRVDPSYEHAFPVEHDSTSERSAP